MHPLRRKTKAMALPLVMHLDGLCRVSELSASLPNTDQLISIDLPVGQGPKAKNLDRDVRTIQASLNKIKTTQGGPAIPLVVMESADLKRIRRYGTFNLSISSSRALTD